MRPLLPGDLTAAARALRAVAPADRADLARRLLQQADAADRYRRRFGRSHPQWGNGTLRAAALAHGHWPEGRLDDPDHRACLMAVLRALSAYPDAQDTQRIAVGSNSRRFSGMSSPQSSQ